MGIADSDGGVWKAGCVVVKGRIGRRRDSEGVSGMKRGARRVWRGDEADRKQEEIVRNLVVIVPSVWTVPTEEGSESVRC